MKKSTAILLLVFTVAAICALAAQPAFAGAWERDGEGNYLNDTGEVIPGVVSRGIDISAHQQTINWDKAEAQFKAGAFDFVIMRVGYGNDTTRYDDTMFTRNADACVKRGIPFGVYLYSYADTVDDAESELAHTLRLIEGYDLAYPVFYNVEWTDGQSELGAEFFCSIVDIYCGGLIELGYESGVCSFRNWFRMPETLGSVDYDGKGYYKWIAEYSSYLNYYDGFDIWQVSSTGSIDGIKTNVDIDYCFMEKRTADHCYLTFDCVIEGANTPLPRHVEKGDLFGNLPVPTAQGKKFEGWYTLESGGERVSADTVITKAGKMRLYAAWSDSDSEDLPPEGTYRADAPLPEDFVLIEPMVKGAMYSLNGLDWRYEYRIDEGEWCDGSISRLRSLRNFTRLEIRRAAEAEYTASESLVYDILDYPPESAFDYATGALKGLFPDDTFYINSEPYPTDSEGKIGISDGWFGTTVILSHIKEGGVRLPLTVSARPGVPTGLLVSHETVYGKSDGVIRGVKVGAEFSRDGGSSWHTVTEALAAESMTYLTPGEYLFRIAGTETEFPGEILKLPVSYGKKLTVIFRAQGAADIVAEVSYLGTLDTIPEIPYREGMTGDSVWSADLRGVKITSDRVVTARYSYSRAAQLRMTVRENISDIAIGLSIVLISVAAITAAVCVKCVRAKRKADGILAERELFEQKE